VLLLENIPLAPLTTLKIGGPSKYFVEARTVGEIQEAVTFARSRDLPLFVLGGGSNLLVADTGWPGLVLKVSVQGIDQRSDHNEDGRTVFEVGAGESWDKFVSHAVIARCAGVECLSGIPGSVGGTPVQNVGAYGQEVSETIASVQVLDLKDNQVRELCTEACEFSYRASIFNTTERGRFIVLRVTYALTPGGSPRITYADLKRHFEGRETPPNLAETREAVRHIPNYPALETRKKVSAAWLVERSGFAKGFGFGRVGISTKHALAIINRGGATAADVLALKEQIQHRVDDIWGVRLEPEPVMVGF
jgi:UDP-N-acetylmuramate dehydrogenase